MTSQQPQPTMHKKLTGNESLLRQKEDDRKKRQRYDGVVAMLETYHARLMGFLLLKGKKSSFPDTDPLSKVSSDPSPQQEVIAERALRAMADVETVIELAVISPIDAIKALPVLPITEDAVLDQIPGQTDKPTISAHEEQKLQAFQKLIADCQEQIRECYLKNFAAKHPNTRGFFQDPECMPHLLKTGGINYFVLKTHYPDGFFPETNKRVRFEHEPLLKDRIICE